MSITWDPRCLRWQVWENYLWAQTWYIWRGLELRQVNDKLIHAFLIGRRSTRDQVLHFMKNWELDVCLTIQSATGLCKRWQDIKDLGAELRYCQLIALKSKVNILERQHFSPRQVSEDPEGPQQLCILLQLQPPIQSGGLRWAKKDIFLRENIKISFTRVLRRVCPYLGREDGQMS